MAPARNTPAAAQPENEIQVMSPQELLNMIANLTDVINQQTQQMTIQNEQNERQE
jgi:hypothetical protein